MLRSKGDQEDTLSTQPWHVYANLHAPYICPVLALPRYILANSPVTRGSKLFDSSDPYQQFSKVLCKCLEYNDAVFNDLGGIDIDEIYDSIPLAKG